MVDDAAIDADGVFEIDKTSGIILTTKKLDREARDVYMVKVGASDQGLPPQEGEVSKLVLNCQENP